MKPKELRWLFIAALAAVIAIGFLRDSPATIGASEEWANGRYDFSAGTAPSAIAFAFVLVLLYVLLVFWAPSESGPPLPGVLKRFAAFWMDFFLALFMIGPIIGIFPIVMEWKRTGAFAWSFERTTPAPTDHIVGAVGIGLSFIALLFYFALPLVRRRPSPGGCIVGYQVVADPGRTLGLWMMLLRTAVAFFAVGWFYLTPFIARDRKNGKVWVDRIFHTRAVRLKH